MPERFSFDTEGDRVTAIMYSAAEPLGLTLLLGHGARVGQKDPFIVEHAEALARRGVLVVTYNFPFAEHGRKVPDRSEVLESCCRAAIVAAWECRPKNRLFIGGKSLGGRVASKVVPAGGDEVENVLGLVLLGYPLHPIGKPEEQRSHHLSQLRIPALFVQGTRDVFGTPDELRPMVDEMPDGSELYVVAGGDHSFAVSSRLPQEQVEAAIYDEIARWMVEITERQERPPARRASRGARPPSGLRTVRRSPS